MPEAGSAAVAEPLVADPRHAHVTETADGGELATQGGEERERLLTEIRRWKAMARRWEYRAKASRAHELRLDRERKAYRDG